MTAASGAAWRIGADIGGTFTDIVALGPNRSLKRIKVPSTPGNYALAISKTLNEELEPSARAATRSFVHGTTIATNAILEEKVPQVALVTTAGFRDVLAMRRSRRPTLYDLTWQPPRELVPRRLRFEVSERVDSGGSVIVPLDDDDIDRCIAAIGARNVIAIAVCLINSHANPAHEQHLARRLREALPTVLVTISSELVSEPKEFERTSTTVVNAVLLPVVEDYVTALEHSLSDIAIHAPLHIMQSDGTTVTSGLVRTRPFAIIESGPAAGVVAAARLAEEMDRRSVIAFDMGGTTAKCALIEDFRPSFTDELEVGDSLNRAGGLMRGSGYAVRAQCVDLSEVGAGGGSIAWVDDGGTLRVGPASAGSEPGPACYGSGGSDPTTTDAHVVLGYLNPEAIAGGTKQIYEDRAQEAVSRIARQLDLSLYDAAFGIYSVANSNMRRAIRTVSVERGRDPRAFSLVAFGGAGGLHAASLAAEVEMSEVVIPVVPGLFSSLGLLFSELAVTRAAAHRALLTPASLSEALHVGKDLADGALETLRTAHDDDEGTPDVELQASLRYVGQSSTLSLPAEWQTRVPDAVASAHLISSFHAEHRRVHGQAAEGEPIEIVSIRARATWKTQPLRFSEIAEQERGEDGPDRSPSERPLYFGPALGWRTARILNRGDVGRDPEFGPLVIEEPEATVVVPPSWSCALHTTGALLLNPLEGHRQTGPRGADR
jgi:N-methylhydantoinase A